MKVSCFEYTMVSRHQGTVTVLASLAGIAALVTIVPTKGRALAGEEWAILGAIIMLMGAVGIAMDRALRRRYGKVVVSESGLQFEPRDGQRVELRWESLSAIAPFGRWDPLGLAGGGHSGLRVQSRLSEIVVYSNIRGWNELRAQIDRKVDALGIRSSRGDV